MALDIDSDENDIREACALGCAIYGTEFHNQPSRYFWEWGRRSSRDQHCASFSSAAEAARHFLASHEGKLARGRRK